MDITTRRPYHRLKNGIMEPLQNPSAIGRRVTLIIASKDDAMVRSLSATSNFTRPGLVILRGHTGSFIGQSATPDAGFGGREVTNATPERN
jgi:hypothetical protein